MFGWRRYLATMVVLALPRGDLWLHAWHIGAGLKWLKPEPDLLTIAVLSAGASALLAMCVARASARS